MASDNLKIEYVPIDDLRPSEYNPRKMNESDAMQLKRSIERFDVVDPLVVNGAPERRNIVIGGHMRLKAAKELGKTSMPVVYVNIPDIVKEQELNIRLNRNMGEFDLEMLANFDEKLLKDVGFNDDELDNIFGLEQADDFDVEKETEKLLKGDPLRTKVGQAWRLGDHRLVIGDSTKRENWERVLGEERFDFMFTDPPYNLAYSNKRVRTVRTKEGRKTKKERVYDTVGNTDKEGKPIRDFPKTGFGAKQNRFYDAMELAGGVPAFDEWLCHADQFQNPKGANVMVFENWKNVVGLWQALIKYWKINNMVIWFLPNRHQGFSAKRRFYSKYDIAPIAGEGPRNLDDEPEMQAFMDNKGQKLLASYEIILYGQKGDSAWNKAKGTRFWMIGDHITWVASSEKSTGQNIVFGTKPIEVLVPYIKILSPREGIVMEPFGGSGSTLIASEIMKRKCRAIELSVLNSEVILRRWEKLTGRKAELINDGENKEQTKKEN